jgi:hypothetical protein
MFRPGDTVGSYAIVRRLGAGGMGEVYLAEHMHIARKAAIKVLLPELSSRQELVARLFNEARATSLIRHPGIVEVLDCGIHPNGQAFIVMELLEGESLGAWLRIRVKLAGDAPLAASLIGQIASAIGAAHDQGIIHRDLKPDNLFVLPGAPAPLIKVLDFGVAKLADSRPGSAGQTGGALLGTPIYMSPEQCRGTGAVDRRTDVYSLGCVAFELLTGRPPFLRTGPGEFIIAHLTEPPPRVESLESAVPPPLGDLVARMLSKDPDGRPQSMTEVIRELLPLVSGSQAGWAGWRPAEGVAVRRAPATVVLPTTAAPTPPATTFQSSASEVRLPTLRQGVSPAVKRVALAAGAVVAAFAVYAVVSGREPARRRAPELPVAPTLVPPEDRVPEQAPPPQPPRAVAVEIVSIPPGAELWVEDERGSRGRTPVVVTTGDLPVTVHLRSPGYLESTLSLTAADAPSVSVTLERSAAARKLSHPSPPRRPKGYIKIED